MGLLRLILLFALGAVLYRFWKRWRRQPTLRRPTTTPPPGSRGQVQMLACAHCGVYIPEHEAVRDGAQAYCCAAHRDAHRTT